METTLENFVFKYLDRKDFKLDSISGLDTFFSVINKVSYSMILRLRNGSVFITGDLQDEISNFFGLGWTVSGKLIVKWVECKLNKECHASSI